MVSTRKRRSSDDEISNNSKEEDSAIRLKSTDDNPLQSSKLTSSSNVTAKSSVESSDESITHESMSNEEISAEEINHAVALATAAVSNKFGWKNASTNSQVSSQENPLSHLIPGYIAPMSLDTSSLHKFKSVRANTFSSSATLIISNKPSENSKNLKRTNHSKSITNKTNAGSGWFHFEATPNSAELQADIAVIRHRNYLDPKKFYKSSDFSKKGSQLVQLGTVIEGSMESIYTNRLTKKQRKGTVLEELMTDVFGSKNDYVKKKFANMQREKSAQGKALSFRKGKSQGQKSSNKRR